MGFPTPDEIPATESCRSLFWPNDEQWTAVITGALNQLAIPDQWDKVGDLTPDEAAAAWSDFFDRFCFKQGTCHVVGEIIPFAGLINPDDRWLLCDGQSIARVDYVELFAQIGTTYGSVDGDHFNVPDLRGRTAVGSGTGTGLTFRYPGDSWGEETHVLTVGELASHSHEDSGHSHSEVTAVATVINGGLEAPASAATPFPGTTGTSSANITNTGGDEAHENMQPSLCINYLIVALP